MGNHDQDINSNYESFYAKRANLKVYPTEFVVRIFLAGYPDLKFRRPVPGDRVLDVAFGDGRNTAFLCDQGLSVSGIEITRGIVDQTRARLERLGHEVDLQVGRNSSIPFDAASFDYILACHCCYYCDEGETFLDNMKEYAWVLKTEGYLIASIANNASYIFKEAVGQPDGSLMIKSDPYGNRNGYRLHGFSSPRDIEDYLSPLFMNFSFGAADNDYFGISERVFWVVCQKG